MHPRAHTHKRTHIHMCSCGVCNSILTILILQLEIILSIIVDFLVLKATKLLSREIAILYFFVGFVQLLSICALEAESKMDIIML